MFAVHPPGRTHSDRGPLWPSPRSVCSHPFQSKKYNVVHIVLSSSFRRIVSQMKNTYYIIGYGDNYDRYSTED